MKTKISIIIAIFLMGFIYTSAHADIGSYALETDYHPNLVNMYLTDPAVDSKFWKETFLSAGWYYWQSADGKQAQVFTLAAAPTASQVSWWQWFNSTPANHTFMNYQEVIWDYATNSATTSYVGKLEFNTPKVAGYSWTDGGAYTGPMIAGQPDITNPHTEVVPIPPSVWLLGAGLIVVGAIRKRIHR